MISRTLGDGILAIFGAPSAQADHADRACRSALRLLDVLTKQATQRSVCEVRVGIHSGEVAVGTARNDFAVNYEPTGVAVAIASRLQCLAPSTGAVISSTTMALIRDQISTQPAWPHAGERPRRPD